MNQKQIIKNYLKDFGDWQYEYKIRAFETPQGYWVGARGDRDVRDMIESEEMMKLWNLEKDKRDGYRIVRYKPPKVETYQVIGNRTQQEIKI